jgi:hypothetical protein
MKTPRLQERFWLSALNMSTCDQLPKQQNIAFAEDEYQACSGSVAERRMDEVP